MPFKIVLILAVLAQITAAILALRLNKRYRWYSAWVLISGAAGMLSILEIAVLLIVWRNEPQISAEFPLWIACLSALLVSVLFVGGVALIEPLFVEIAQAEDLLKQEKQRLENVVEDAEAELQLARQIQQKLLPASAPILEGFDLAGASLPAEWTSGDYYDFIELSDGSYFVVIADVSGHGTGPALLMTSTRAFLRALAQTHDDVGVMLTLANRAIAADVDHGRFVTAFLARLDPKNKTLVHGSAGHDGFLLNGEGLHQTLSFGGPPLGAVPDTTVENAPMLQLHGGNILLLVSDGIPETESPGGEQFGMQRTMRVVEENRDRPAEEIVDCLLRTIRQFAENTAQRDDATVVIVKVEN